VKTITFQKQETSRKKKKKTTEKNKNTKAGLCPRLGTMIRILYLALFTFLLVHIVDFSNSLAAEAASIKAGSSGGTGFRSLDRNRFKRRQNLPPGFKPVGTAVNARPNATPNGRAGTTTGAATAGTTANNPKPGSTAITAAAAGAGRAPPGTGTGTGTGTGAARSAAVNGTRVSAQAAETAPKVPRQIRPAILDLSMPFAVAAGGLAVVLGIFVMSGSAAVGTEAKRMTQVSSGKNRVLPMAMR